MAAVDEQHLRIITLRAENVKRLKAVEITPDGDTVVIAGRNAQGKSSVLDAIWMALAGGSGAKETSRPIRDGESKASVMLDLGDLIVTRRWTPTGTTLEVSARDGARYSSPQTILDSLIGRLSFDPLAFAEEDPRKQLQTLLDIVELPFDPEHLDAVRRGVFEDRTDLNRQAKQLDAQLAGLPTVPENTPDDEISASAIAAELREAEEGLTYLRTAQSLAEGAERDVAEGQGRLAEAQEHLEKALARLSRDQANLAAIAQPPDPAPIRGRLETLDSTNAAVRTKRERIRITEELAAVKEAADARTAELARIDREKADAIAAAKMPLEGLSFDEDGVLYQGVPFSQASSAERLRVGIAMAMALNPRIRVIRITDGSLLDSENLALIEQMAGEHDFQIWIERVDETGTVGVTIEDGQVVGQELDPTPQTGTDAVPVDAPAPADAPYQGPPQ